MCSLSPPCLVSKSKICVVTISFQKAAGRLVHIILPASHWVCLMYFGDQVQLCSFDQIILSISYTQTSSETSKAPAHKAVVSHLSQSKSLQTTEPRADLSSCYEYLPYVSRHPELQWKSNCRTRHLKVPFLTSLEALIEQPEETKTSQELHLPPSPSTSHRRKSIFYYFSERTYTPGLMAVLPEYY